MLFTKAAYFSAYFILYLFKNKVQCLSGKISYSGAD